MGDRDLGEARYRAFLSYSHKDAAAAGRLHRRLEAYRIPSRLVGRETLRGPVPARLWPIFRDREELPAATDLSETVREALEQSGALIVLCSPAAAASLWVAEEIKVFRELHPGRPILAAILEGDPPDCFPPLLRAMGDGHEPLATDLRRERDGERLGVLKLAAGMTGLGLDDLVQRDATRRVRRVMAVTAGAVAAMLVMAVLVVVAVTARREAERQRAAAEGQIEFMLTDLRTRLKGVGRVDVRAAVNQQALRYYGGEENLAVLPADSLERRARALLALSEDNLELGNHAAAAQGFWQAHRVTEEQLARDPDNAERIFAHAQSEYYVGFADYERRNYVGARAAWLRYRALAYRLLQIDVRNPRWIKEVAYAEGNLCTALLRLPVAPTLAVEPCRASLRRMEEARDLQGMTAARMDVPMTIALANRHAWLSKALDVAGNWTEAQVQHARFEVLARRLLATDPDNSDYLDIWMQGQIGFSDLLERHGQRNQALPRLREAISMVTRLRSRDPLNQRLVAMEAQLNSRLARTANGGLH